VHPIFVEVTVIEKINEIRASLRPSPFYPSLYFLAAIKGKKTTGTSLISSQFSKLSGDDSLRKLIHQSFTSPPKNKKELRRFLSKKGIQRLINGPLLKEVLPRTLKFLLKLRSYHWRSSEGIGVESLLNRMKGDGFEVNIAISYNDQLAEFEKVFFKERPENRIQNIGEYFLLPKSFQDELSGKVSEVPLDYAKQVISLLDLIKLQNLYCDLTARCGFDLSEFEHIEKSEPGSHTKHFFERLLDQSEASNWAGVQVKIHEDHNILIDISDLRSLRNGKNCMLYNRLEKVLSALNASPLALLSYYTAFCADWHYRQLDDNLKGILNAKSVVDRLCSATDRWNTHILPYLPKSSPPSAA